MKSITPEQFLIDRGTLKEDSTMFNLVLYILKDYDQKIKEIERTRWHNRENHNCNWNQEGCWLACWWLWMWGAKRETEREVSVQIKQQTWKGSDIAGSHCKEKHYLLINTMQVCKHIPKTFTSGHIPTLCTKSGHKARGYHQDQLIQIPR